MYWYDVTAKYWQNKVATSKEIMYNSWMNHGVIGNIAVTIVNSAMDVGLFVATLPQAGGHIMEGLIKWNECPTIDNWKAAMPKTMMNLGNGLEAFWSNPSWDTLPGAAADVSIIAGILAGGMGAARSVGGAATEATTIEGATTEGAAGEAAAEQSPHAPVTAEQWAEDYATRYGATERVPQKGPVEAEWYRSTFNSVADSMDYHMAEHGNGRTVMEYTSDAMEFFQLYKNEAKPCILNDGSPGLRIKVGKSGGYWTKDGRLVTFWD